jgi:hypothetical protein
MYAKIQGHALKLRNYWGIRPRADFSSAQRNSFNDPADVIVQPAGRLLLLRTARQVPMARGAIAIAMKMKTNAKS